jgi:O-antigen/teichoic acid export membrane protein
MAAPASLAVMARSPTQSAAGGLGLRLGASERSRTGRRAVTAFLVRTTSAALLYLTQVALARWMGAYDYGIYVFVWTWVLMLGSLSNLGLSTAVLRLIPQHRERDEQAALRGLLLGGRLLVLSVASSIALVGLVLLWCLGERVAAPYAVPAYLGLICIPILTLTDLQDGVARARGLMALGLLPPYVLRPLLLIVGLGAAHLCGLPVDARIAIAVAIVASLGAAIVQTLLLRRRLRRELPPGPHRYAFALWLKTALPFWLIVACDLTLQNADVLVISSYLGPAEVGMYFAAAKTMSFVLFIHYAVASAMANRIAALDVRGNEEDLRAAVADAANWIFWPSLAAGAAILLVGKPMLWFFNPQFQQAYPVMVILAIGLLTRAALGPADVVLNMLGQGSASALLLVASALLSVALSAALVPVFGLGGAATATSLAFVAVAAGNCALARRRLNLRTAIWHNLDGLWRAARRS